MRINRIYLGDFGVFQNQLLEGLGNGLVVIGGPNRAGKTTLMTALRSLGYSISRRTAPSAVKEHELRAGVERGGDKYSIFLTGYGKAKVVAEQGAPELSIQELYNNLDEFTYRQIFTISLDELRQVPESLGSGEQERVGAVLLGAGWNDALRLTELLNKLEGEANRLGGKKGDISTNNFAPHYDMLCEGLKLRDAANARMDEYEAKCLRLVQVGEELIPVLERKLEANGLEMQRLELLAERYANYELFSQNRQLLEEEENSKLWKYYPRKGLETGQELRGRYAAVLEQERAARERFAMVAGQQAAGELQEKLLQEGKNLEFSEVRVSGWEARVKVVRSNGEELEKRSLELERELAGLYAPWGKTESLQGLSVVEADQHTEQELQQAAYLHQELGNELRQQERDLAGVEAELEAAVSRRDKLPPDRRGAAGKVTWLALADVLLVVCLGLVLPPGVAVTAGLAGAVAILAYFLVQNSRVETRQRQLEGLEQELVEKEAKRAALAARREQLQGELEENGRCIAKIKRECRIPEAVGVSFLKEFIMRVRQMQRLAGELKDEKKKLDRLEEELEKELRPLAEMLGSIGIIEEDFDDVLERCEILFSRLEQGLVWLKAARELQYAQQEKAAVEQAIHELLQKVEMGAGEAVCLEETADAGRTSAGASPPPGDETAAAPWSRLQDGVPREKRETGPTLVLLLDEFIEQGQKYAELAAKWQENSTLQLLLTAGLDSARWRPRLLSEKEEEEEEEGEEGEEGDMAGALLGALAAWCEEFGEVGEIVEVLSKLQEEALDLEAELQHLKEEQRDLQREVEELGSDSKLLEARQKIDQAGQGIREKLEQYAVLRLAGLLLQQTRERLLEQTKGKLLAPAGEIFRRLTGGAYGEIGLPNGSTKVEFEVRLTKNEQEQAVNILSRGTREQLFFAMRLSRIRDIMPPLPVIFDDTFTNFDPAHLREAVRYLAELAGTHQVFVFTCHPQLLDYIQDYSGTAGAQYWSLEDGHFGGPYSDCSEVRRLLLA